MRFEGHLTSWNDERGFGHIEPLLGGEKIFIHVSAWPRNSGRPQLHQQLSFEVELGSKGKRAKSIQLIRAPRTHHKSERAQIAQWGTATLFVLPLFLILYAVIAIVWKPPIWIAAAYAMLSLVTFLAYALDKSAAANGSWRISEQKLHVLSLFGGWPGALLAQQFLRHKSAKQEFRQTFWATVVINVLVLLIFCTPLRKLLNLGL